jgi:hypothetical protein
VRLKGKCHRMRNLAGCATTTLFPTSATVNDGILQAAHNSRSLLTLTQGLPDRLPSGAELTASFATHATMQCRAGLHSGSVFVPSVLASTGPTITELRRRAVGRAVRAYRAGRSTGDIARR